MSRRAIHSYRGGNVDQRVDASGESPPPATCLWCKEPMSEAYKAGCCSWDCYFSLAWEHQEWPDETNEERDE